MSSEKPYIDINELDANRYKVSAEKYGFFLCVQGKAEILLGAQTYRIGPKHLCIYTPNTTLYIISKSPDLTGVMMQGSIEEYYPVVCTIDIRKRLKMRNEPCVIISQCEVETIIRFSDLIKELNKQEHSTQDITESTEKIRTQKKHYLRQALCMQIFDTYFNNSPIEAQPLGKKNIIFNRFLISLYSNCIEKRNVSFYAEEQNLSPYYFSNIVKESSGLSVMQWIEEFTMTLAKQELECSNNSIKEIANKLNFPCQSTFGRYFKQRAKMSPGEYRNMISHKELNPLV